MRADILELFQSYSEPDEFEQQYQLSLFAWGMGRSREAQRDRKRAERGPVKQVHLCSVCGEEGHRGMWRGAVICTNAPEARAA